MNRWPLIASGTLLGVGLGGFVDGIAFHQLLLILGVHHVVERLGLSVYDYAFLGCGVLLITIGLSFIHRGRADDCRVARTSR